MNIVFFTTCGYRWGGSEVLWTRTAKEALKNGHNVAISIFDFEEQHEKINELIHLGAVPYFRRRFYPKISKRIKKKVLNLFLSEEKKYTYNNELKDFLPDHVFFNLAGGNEIVQDEKDLFIFIKQIKTPFSVFYHSNLNKNQLTNSQKENFRIVISKAKYNFFTSKFQIKLIEQEIGIQLKNSQILTHPLREIKKVEKNIEIATEVRMCIIGSIVFHWKGHDMLINVLSKSKWRNLLWVLNVYGEGANMQELKKLVIENGLNHKVNFHGYSNDINDVFASNDIVLIPSRKDSGPIVMFEAMLAALPVVGTFMGAMTDKIKTGENGVLANGVKEEDFEKAISFAWENHDNWEKWGKAGRNQMLMEYEFDPHIKLLELITNSNSDNIC
jgi:glycosyltransferase involved in cell wall biosynthesis